MWPSKLIVGIVVCVCVRLRLMNYSAIVATGLIVLIDDCIRRRWHSRRPVQLLQPVRASFSKSIDLLGPRRLLDEVFHRRGST